MDTAVALTGMEYGGITPVGLPTDWPILVDQNVAVQSASSSAAASAARNCLSRRRCWTALPPAEVLTITKNV